MPAIKLQLSLRQPVDLGNTAGTSNLNRTRQELFRRVLNEVRGGLGGASPDGEFIAKYEPGNLAVANTGLAISGGSGSVGATLNGVATTATWATSDTVAAAAIANAINTSVTAKVKGMFQASNLTATITCSGVLAGDSVSLLGATFNATTGLPGGYVSGAALMSFDRSGTDAQTATNLAAAINARPVVSRYVFAVPVSNVVRVFARQWAYSSVTGLFSWPTQPRTPVNLLWASNATRLAVSGSSLAAGAFVGIYATVEGVVGNCFSIAASGTGVSVLNAETYLMRGTGFDSTGVIDQA